MANIINRVIELGKADGINWLRSEITVVAELSLQSKKYLVENAYEQIVGSANEHLNELTRNLETHSSYQKLLEETLLIQKESLLKELNNIIQN